MRKLVEKDGSKKQHAGEDAHGPMLSGAPLRVGLCELHAQGIGDQGENQQPAGVQIDGDPKDAADSEA